MPRPRQSTSLRSVSLALATACTATLALSAAPPSRLRADAALSTDRASLPQAISGRLAKAQSLGGVPGATTLESMVLVLAPTAAQTKALDQLLADQQNPASASFHKWLTPAQFGDQFGIASGDLQVLENWLTSQGLQVVSVPASRNAIQFSGSAANVETAFHAGLQQFKRDGQTFISNTNAPSIPSAFVGIVGGVQGLSTYRLQSHHKQRMLTEQESAALAHPELTGGTATSPVHELAPYDVRQIYGANGLFSSGYTGSGITIGVIGQTAVSTTQLGYFQTLTGQPVVPPTLTLVPGTGTSTVVAGDEGESEADLEFAGGVAQGATINFIYTGNGNGGVFTALQYAITSNLAPILTLSYGGCEIAQGSDLATMEPYLRQASAQGQTVINSSGDSGAAACDSDSLPTAYDGLAVNYPASSPNVIGVGGTTFSEGSGTYWSTTNNSQNGSALSYIPEVTWNDSNSTSFGASGGGTSIVFSKPSWQVGTGVPSDTFRHVPDIAFSAAYSHDPYIYCTADPSTTGTTSTGATVTGACTATTGGGFIVGGTSLSAPSFAGMLALVEQANSSKRLGNINPALYALAATNSGVFNDITTGSNQVPCLPGIPGCVNAMVGYTAGVGYDQVTGLGSVNIGTFSAAISASATATVKTPTLTILNTSNSGTTSTFSVNVGSGIAGGAVPTGTVSVTVDGGTATTATLTNGAATFSLSTQGLSGSTHAIVATYGGDTNYNSATTTFTLNTGTSVGTFALTVNPTTLAVASGGAGTAILTLSSTGYTGLVLYSLTPASGSATAPGCFTGANGDYTNNGATAANGGNTVALDTGVTAGSTVSASIKYHATTASCSTLSQLSKPAGNVFTAAGTTGRSHLPWAAFAFGGFVLGGLTLRRRTAQARLLSSGLLAIAFTFAVLGVTGCGNGSAPLSTTTTTTTTTTGSAITYNYVVTASSYPAGTTVGTANLTITVQ